MSENNENTPPRLFGRLAVMVVAGALFAYPFWTSLGNLLNLPSYYQAQFGVSVDTVPWALLVAGVALPVITFGAAAIAGWKRGAGSMALLKHVVGRLFLGIEIGNDGALGLGRDHVDIDRPRLTKPPAPSDSLIKLLIAIG